MQLELFHEFRKFSEYKFSSMPKHLQLLSREWNLEDAVNCKKLRNKSDNRTYEMCMQIILKIYWRTRKGG